MRARDIDKVITIKLKHLDETQEAFDLVRQGPRHKALPSQPSTTKSVRTIALLWSSYCWLASPTGLRSGADTQPGGGVHGVPGRVHRQRGSPQGGYSLREDPGAGQGGALLFHVPAARGRFIQCGDREIDTAIEVIGEPGRALTHELIDFLVGEKDGVPKNPNYITDSTWPSRSTRTLPRRP